MNAPTTNRLTPRQAERLIYLLAYGPQDERPVDASLFEMGWLQRYDGTDGVETVDEAEKALYDDTGRIKSHLIPEEWKRQLPTL